MFWFLDRLDQQINQILKDYNVLVSGQVRLTDKSDLGRLQWFGFWTD